MPINRFYINAKFFNGGSAHMDKEELIHLVKATRRREGETVELINGRGFLAKGLIQRVTKESAHLTLSDVVLSEKEEKECTLFMPIIHHTRLEWVVEKGVELGVTTFAFYIGDKSPKTGLSSNNKKRLESIIIAAIKQCGRLYLPKIEEVSPIEKWESLPKKSFYGDLEKGDYEKKEDGPVGFIVGPESGFSEKEIAKLKDLGALPLNLSENILRTETAALVGIFKLFS